MTSVRGDEGSATVWAAGITAVLIALLAAGMHLVAAVGDRHRAGSAADLAALAAAADAVLGEERACLRAAEVARQRDTRLRTCLLDGWDALVEVESTRPPALPGIDGPATGRARAGPAPPGQRAGPAPPGEQAGPALTGQRAGPAPPDGRRPASIPG